MQKQHVAFSQQQQQAFVAQLQQDDTNVHGVEARGGLMLAHIDMGCAYTDGSKMLRVEGEQQHGELHMNDVYVGEYSTDEQWLTLHLTEGDLCYENNEGGWDEMARDVLSGECMTMDLC